MMKKTLLTLLATAAALSASAWEIELLTNGAGTTLDGWVNAYSGSGSAFGIQTIDDVSWFASSYNTCRLSQTVTLADYGFAESDILAHPTVTASGIFLANSGSSVCNVTVYELGASGNEIASHLIMNRPGETISSATAFSNTFSLNSSTRKLKYELRGDDSKDWAGYYGPKFRNCSLTVELVSDTVSLFDKQVLTIAGDVTWQGRNGLSPINVAAGARAVINIKTLHRGRRNADCDGRRGCERRLRRLRRQRPIQRQRRRPAL